MQTRFQLGLAITEALQLACRARTNGRVLSDKCEPVSVTPYPNFGSGSDKVAPPVESGSAGLLVGVAVLEVALRRKVVEDRGMN